MSHQDSLPVDGHVRTHTEMCLFQEKVKSLWIIIMLKKRQKENNENREAERGNNDSLLLMEV